MTLKFPFSRFVVRDKSMEPDFVEGDRVLTFNWVQPKIGDAIVFKNDGLYLIKRVIKTSGSGFLVRGDNRMLSSKVIDVRKIEFVGKVFLKY